MTQLALSNIVNISVATPQTGLGQYNTSNLAVFTHETPLAVMSDGYKIYKSASEVSTDFGPTTITAKIANNVFGQNPNILSGSGYLVVIPLVGGTEKLDVAILRTKELVQYFGIIATKEVSDVDGMASAAAVQPLNKIQFLAKRLASDVDSSAFADDIKLAKYTKTRVLLYLTDATTDEASVLMAAAYSGRALSTNFSGSNTTQTMHMKDLVGVQPDLAMTQTIIEKCKLVGADVYASFQGVPKVFSTGANGFFDQVYNLAWIVGALEVAGFNFLATSNTKIPQTENGVSGLKSAYRQVLEQAIANQYVGAGSWTSPDTFGNLEDFHRNIIERGYYIFSIPLSQQSSADRTDRKCPLISMAIKEAGAIHSSSVIININA